MVSPELDVLAQACAKRFSIGFKKFPRVFMLPDNQFEETTLAFYRPKANEIYFKASYVLTATPGHLADTMLHELAHAWQRQYGGNKSQQTHDELFQQIYDNVKVTGNETD